MRTLLLNSTYEPLAFIKFRKMIKLIVNNKVDKVSAWNSGIKHGQNYDLVCGARLEFYDTHYHDRVMIESSDDQTGLEAFGMDPLKTVEHAGVTYKFCKQECADLFEMEPLEFLHPAIIRLKRYAPRHVKKRRYNRTGVFKRDKYTCQYCGTTCSASDLTIDHVLPRDMNGVTSWENCVACCFDCNNKKANRTPKMAKMPLLHKPFAVKHSIWNEFNLMRHKHTDWIQYCQ